MSGWCTTSVHYEQWTERMILMPAHTTCHTAACTPPPAPLPRALAQHDHCPGPEWTRSLACGAAKHAQRSACQRLPRDRHRPHPPPPVRSICLRLTPRAPTPLYSRERSLRSNRSPDCLPAPLPACPHPCFCRRTPRPSPCPVMSCSRGTRARCVVTPDGNRSVATNGHF